jgi:hypothetical protein
MSVAKRAVFFAHNHCLKKGAKKKPFVPYLYHEGMTALKIIILKELKKNLSYHTYIMKE